MITRVLDGYLVHGIPLYLALGASSSASDVHTITPALTSQPSFRLHYEEKDGDENIYADVIGCVAHSLSLMYDADVDGKLRVGIGVGAIEARDSQDGSKPAVALTNRPTWPTNSVESDLCFQTSAAGAYWDYDEEDGSKVAFEPRYCYFMWNNNLDMPQYEFQDSGELWPSHAGRKIKPGQGTLSTRIWMNKRWPLNKFLNETQRTLSIKFVAPGAASSHYLRAEFEDAMITRYLPTRKIGEKIEAIVDFAFDAPEFTIKDGITANSTWYGE
jgi:hypothetical protein